jgi:hypothetical protein
MKKKVFSLLRCMTLIAFILSTPNASAEIVFDWNDGTTQGWSPVEPFNGTLGVDTSFGNPAGSLYAIDTLPFGGILIARAPSVLSGDLGICSGIQWDEYKLQHFMPYPTRVFIHGTDGTVYTTNLPVGPTETWITRFAAFDDQTVWVLYAGSASLSDVIHNVEWLGIDLDTSDYSGAVESYVDNVRLRSAIPIDSPYVYTVHWGDSAGVLPAGHFFILGAFVPRVGITVTAQQLSGGSRNVNLTYWPTPLYPNEYDYRTSYDSSFNGKWQIKAADGVCEATKVTSTLDDPRLLPLAETFSVSGSTGALTPTLSWTGFDSGQFPGFSGNPVDGSDNYTLKVRARDMKGRTLGQTSDLSTNVTSFTIPAENALVLGRAYLLEVMLNHYDYESGAWYLENRSETFVRYATEGTSICLGDFDYDSDVDGSDLAALIANPGWLDVTTFAQKFGKNACP